jgi:hypothetical protein
LHEFVVTLADDSSQTVFNRIWNQLGRPTGDPGAFVISLNLHRRHLSESQRAAVAVKLANITHADAGRMGAAAQGKAPADLLGPPVSRAQAAELLNVSERSVRAAAKVLHDDGRHSSVLHNALFKDRRRF